MFCNSCGSTSNNGKDLCETCSGLAKDCAHAVCVKCGRISAVLTDAEKEDSLIYYTSTCRSCDVNKEEVMLLTKSYKKLDKIIK